MGEMTKINGEYGDVRGRMWYLDILHDKKAIQVFVSPPSLTRKREWEGLAFVYS
jgi:hypothetical protein